MEVVKATLLEGNKVKIELIENTGKLVTKVFNSIAEWNEWIHK